MGGPQMGERRVTSVLGSGKLRRNGDGGESGHRSWRHW